MSASCNQLIECFGSLFALWTRPHRPSRSAPRGRRLCVETLETRLALSGVPLAADISLVDYLSQTPEMGPLLPPIAETGGLAAPALDAATIEAADALAANLAAIPPTPTTEEPEGEGESVSPILLTFSVLLVDGGYVRLFGTLSDDDPATVTVAFGDVFDGEFTLADSSGYFNVFVQDPGYGGTVTAKALDADANLSNTLLRLL